MITGGIDVGIKYTKVVIFDNDKLVVKKQGLSGGINREQNVAELWNAAVKEALLESKDIEAIGVTGKGKYNLSCGDVRKTELICMIKAAKYLCPDATMVANIGADEVLVAVMNDDGTILEYFQNQKCSAGLGMMIDNLADEFGWDYEKVSSLNGENAIKVSDGCTVFARMDVLEHMNKGACAEDVMRAVIHAAAVRTNATINDITFSNEEKFLLLGGLSKNEAFVEAMSAKKGVPFITHELAEYGCAIGAALCAVDWKSANE